MFVFLIQIAGARTLTGADWHSERGADSRGDFPRAMDELETALLDACATEADWPAQIAAAIYAGVDYAIAHPAAARALAVGDPSADGSASRYQLLIHRLVELIRVKAPVASRLPGSTDEVLVAGIVGLVGDHIRIGRPERLAKLRPELVLLALLPYLGFAEAQRWANRAADTPAL